MKKPYYYYDVLQRINNRKILYKDQYQITIFQRELADEMRVSFNAVNECFRIFKRNRNVIKKGSFYYLTQKGVKSAAFADQYQADFNEFFVVLHKLVESSKIRSGVRTIGKSKFATVPISCVDPDERKRYLEIMEQEDLIEQNSNTIMLTDTGIEKYQIWKQNFYM